MSPAVMMMPRRTTELPREPKQLTSMDNARIKAVVRLREHRQRRRTGQFTAESERQIRRALDAGLKLVELYWCPDLLDAAEMLDGQADGFVVTEPLIRKMAYRENPEGVVAVFEQPTWSLQTVLSNVAAGGGLCVVAVGLEKPGNLGAIARSADAAGAAAVILADGVVDPFNPNAIRASTAAVFSLPTVAGDSADVIAALQHQGIRIVTASLDAATSCFDADLTGPLALVIGAEDRGVPPVWRDAGEAVSIPMAGRTVDSLNASNAAAVLLFEATRQRMHKP